MQVKHPSSTLKIPESKQKFQFYIKKKIPYNVLYLINEKNIKSNGYKTSSYFAIKDYVD